MKFSELAEKIKVSRAALEKDKDVADCLKRLDSISVILEDIPIAISSILKPTLEDLIKFEKEQKSAMEEKQAQIKRLSEENGSLFARVEKLENALAELTRQRIL